MDAPRTRMVKGRRTRGSTLVYILVLTIAMCTVVLTLISMAGYQYGAVTHSEQIKRAQYALEGACTQVRFDVDNANQTVPYSSTVTVGSFSVPVTVSDNSGSIPYTASVAASTTRWDDTFTGTFIIGNAGPVSQP